MQTDASITVEGSTFRYVLDRRTGLFSSMSFANRSLLNRPMELNVWRAPTDNDQYIKADWIRAQYDRAQARAYEVGVLVDEDDIIAKPESIELRADDEDAPVASFGDDAILDDGGEIRRELLPQYYAGPHPRWINERVLPAVFEHLCTTGLPLSVVVFAEGVAQATGDWVWLLPRPIRPAPDALERLLRTATESDRIALVGPTGSGPDGR